MLGMEWPVPLCLTERELERLTRPSKLSDGAILRIALVSEWAAVDCELALLNGDAWSQT